MGVSRGWSNNLPVFDWQRENLCTGGGNDLKMTTISQHFLRNSPTCFPLASALFHPVSPPHCNTEGQNPLFARIFVELPSGQSAPVSNRHRPAFSSCFTSNSLPLIRRLTQPSWPFHSKSKEMAQTALDNSICLTNDDVAILYNRNVFVCVCVCVYVCSVFSSIYIP